MNFLSLIKRKILFKLKKKISIDKEILLNKNLDELFYHYGSDKAENVRRTGKKGHGYSKYYDNHFKEIKNNKINILEIGSYAGRSAAAFSKYFTNSKIFCFDINISNFLFSSKQIEVFGLDINDKNRVKKYFNIINQKYRFKNFDLIIDDGSHNLSDILFSLNFFFKYLNNNGIYVIEDFKFPNYYDYNKNVDDILIDELLTNIIDKRTFKSSIINEQDQMYLFNNIKKIDMYRGNLSDSDICFIRKK